MKKVIKGENDIFSLNPEWKLYCDYEKNKEENIDVFSLSRFSHIKVYWKCKNCGTKFSKIVSNVKEEILCNSCSLKKGISKKYLSRIDKEGSLAVKYPEIAKEWHPTKNGNLTPDMVKAGSGKKVWWQCKQGHEWQATIASRSNGAGCPYCSGRNVIKRVNDLATVNPELASEWHPTKNGELTPDMVTKGSGRKVWWQCGQEHEWQATIASRSSGVGCPICRKSKNKQ